MNSLQNRVVIVIGASGGMGQAITTMLAENGAIPVLASTEPSRLEQLQQQISGDHLAQFTDATNEDSVRSLFDAVKERYGQAHALINLPGVSVAAKVADMALTDYDRIVDLNLKTAFLVTKYFVPLAVPNAQLLYMSSMASRRANPNAPIYVSAKAALTMFGEAMAMQLKENSIRVTGLRPGATDTDGFWGDRPVPREKFMRPADIAEVVKFVLMLPSHIVMHEIAFESYEFFKR